MKFEQSQGEQARPVMGVFVGWRGMSKYGAGDAIADLTFWDRQAAGARVATGSVRELFGRLRGYRNRRRDAKGTPLLVIAGHSFGGMVVYSALEQALIDAAATPLGEVVSGFADLVLLVNPAIAGTRYLPVYDIVSSDGFKNGRASQLPIFVCAQAENDQPVGVWFPIGNADHKPDQVKGPLEEECVSHALGFVKEFRTHEVSGPNGGDDFSLNPPDIEGPNPLWVIGAAQAVIDGHGGIWQEPFEEMLKAIVFTHMLASTGTHRLPPLEPLTLRMAAWRPWPALSRRRARLRNIDGPRELAGLNATASRRPALINKGCRDAGLPLGRNARRCRATAKLASKVARPSLLEHLPRFPVR